MNTYKITFIDGKVIKEININGYSLMTALMGHEENLNNVDIIKAELIPVMV
jgi:hypothetical protein